MKQVLSSVFTILNRQEKIKLVVLTALDLVISLLDIIFLGLLVLIINFYTKNGTAGNRFLLFFQPGKNSLLIIGVFLLLFCFKNSLGWLISKAQNSFFYRVATRLSRQNILNFLTGDYSRFIHIDSSVYIRKISQQPIEFSSYILTNIQQVVSQGALILFTLTAIVFYHPLLFALLFLLLLPPVFLLAYVIKKRLRHIRENTKITSQKAIQYLQESLSGYIESNVYDKTDFFTGRYQACQQHLNENIAAQQTLQGLPPRLIEVFAIMGFFILIAINKYSISAPGINLLNVGVFMAASYKIIPGVVKILNSTGQIKTYQFIVDDLLPACREPASTQTATTAININAIKFEQVKFSYQQHTVLKRLCFEFGSGDLVGISGKSGLGKTTVINLLLGFLTPDSGTILINNKQTDVAERRRLWPQIAYAKQQPFFINDTVLKNIVLTDGDYNTAKLAEAMVFCGIDRMLRQYPEGCNKIITENGKNISGGQRQRIMLARALYRDADLLILDEPFSEMDEDTETDLLSKLQQLAKQGKIIIIITHNKASLAYCNKILSLGDE